MKFKVGDVVFFRSDSIISKLISIYNLRYYGEMGFTHVGIITKVEKDKVLIHEALSNGFVKTKKNGKLNYYNNDYILKQMEEGSMDVLSTKLKLKNVYKTSEKYIGRPYAWFDIFGIALSFLFNFKFTKLTGADKLICSEAVSRILFDASNKKINLSEEFNKPYDLIAPQDIYNSKYVNG